MESFPRPAAAKSARTVRVHAGIATYCIAPLNSCRGWHDAAVTYQPVDLSRWHTTGATG